MSVSEDARFRDFPIVADFMYEVPGRILLEYRELKRASRSGPSDREVEAAARALHHFDYPDGRRNRAGADRIQFDDEIEPTQQEYLNAARAALVAARSVGEDTR
jgi:hypothetical protein